MDIMNEKEMAEPFALSMLPGEAKDTLIDYAEIGLDAVGSLLDGPGYDLLKEFPILRTIGAVGKVAKNIRERHQTKKLLAFLQEVKEGNADQKEIERRIQAAQKGEKWFIREVEEVFVYLDRQTSAYKSKIFGRIYIDCMSGVISYDQRIEYYDILDQLFLCDIDQLTELLLWQINLDKSSNLCYTYKHGND
ncbi:MAG: hypothetical protein IKN04_06685 [Clostridia bacterium]|nr:hypothetical protein [Clostridia bacterium]